MKTYPKMIFYNPAKAILRVLKLPHKIEKKKKKKILSAKFPHQLSWKPSQILYNAEAIKC